MDSTNLTANERLLIINLLKRLNVNVLDPEAIKLSTLAASIKNKFDQIEGEKNAIARSHE